MNYREARYLKHMGQLIDVKVTIKIRDKQPVIYIRDLELYSFTQARMYLQSIAETELVKNEFNVI